MVEWLNDILLDGLVCLDGTESSGFIFLPFPDGLFVYTSIAID